MRKAFTARLLRRGGCPEGWLPRGTKEKPGFPGYLRQGSMVRHDDVWWGEGAVDGGERVRVVLHSSAKGTVWPPMREQHCPKSLRFTDLIN